LAGQGGIDEAGYGPLLGPLVVTGTSFEVPPGASQACLWDLLQAGVTRTPTRRDHRLPITDSKKLYSRSGGIKHLERTALVMISAGGHSVESFGSLLAGIAPDVIAHLAEYPWYRDFDMSLPMANDAADISLCANAVRKNMTDNGVRLAGVYCEPVLAGGFNRLIAQTRNKATASLGITVRVIDRIRRGVTAGDGCVFVDRQGGRTHYRQTLTTALGVQHIKVLAESDTESVYELESGDRIMFVTRGETHHLPIALASVVSKYVRELFMVAFNRFWADRVPGLKPTAGYYTDARRFLSDIAEAVARETLPEACMVRTR
jgi:ribonuclease HII